MKMANAYVVVVVVVVAADLTMMLMLRVARFFPFLNPSLHLNVVGVLKTMTRLVVYLTRFVVVRVLSLNLVWRNLLTEMCKRLHSLQ